jgi:hypothetical protein
MSLRSKAHWFVGACCFVLIQGNLAIAQPKSSGSGKSAEKSAAPSPAPSSKPLPKAIQEVPVCARPKELQHGEDTWGYDAKDKLIRGNVKEAVQAAGTTKVYVFKLSASIKSVDQLPAPYNDLRCPGDQRPPKAKPNAAPAPAPTSIRELLSTPAPKKGQLPPRVEDFCSWVKDFRPPETADGKLAMAFATKLRTAIMDDSAMGVVTVQDLSIEAAEILSRRFREKIIAALVYKQVVAPYNVQRKFMEFVGDPQWRRFPLLSDQWVTESKVGTTDTVPTVILKHIVYEEVNKSLSAQLANVKSFADASTAYPKAYADVSSWLDAIAQYFAPKPAPILAQQPAPQPASQPTPIPALEPAPIPAVVQAPEGEAAAE